MTNGYDGRLTPMPHPLHDALSRHADADPNPAGAALRGVLTLHTPAAGVGSVAVCEECAVQSWPFPDDARAWAHTAYPCPTVRQLAAACGLTSTEEERPWS